MKSSTSWFVMTVLLLTVLGAESLVTTFGNPLGPSTLPETPDTSKPLIRIQTPEPNKVYNAKSIPFSITIEKPASWVENGTGYVRSVGYTLDGKGKVTIADTSNPSISASIEEPGRLVFAPNPDYIDLNSENRTISLEGNLSGLPEGNHTIQVWVNSVATYHPADTPQDFYGWWAAVAEVPVTTSSSVVHFSVTSQVIETPANGRTTSTPFPSPVPQQTEPFPTTSVATSVSIVAVTAVLLFYFKKRNSPG